MEDHHSLRWAFDINFSKGIFEKAIVYDFAKTPLIHAHGILFFLAWYNFGKFIK